MRKIRYTTAACLIWIFGCAPRTGQQYYYSQTAAETAHAVTDWTCFCTPEFVDSVYSKQFPDVVRVKRVKE